MRKLYPGLFLCFPFNYPEPKNLYRQEQAPLLNGIPDDTGWQQVTPTDIPLTSTPVFGQPALPS